MGEYFTVFQGLGSGKKNYWYGYETWNRGVVTFKNGKIDKFLNQIDISNIVLETDSPYLSPFPEEKKWEFKHKIYCRQIMWHYNLSFHEIAEINTKNSKDVFRV